MSHQVHIHKLVSTDLIPQRILPKTLRVHLNLVKKTYIFLFIYLFFTLNPTYIFTNNSSFYASRVKILHILQLTFCDAFWLRLRPLQFLINEIKSSALLLKKNKNLIWSLRFGAKSGIEEKPAKDIGSAIYRLHLQLIR